MFGRSFYSKFLGFSLALSLVLGGFVGCTHDGGGVKTENVQKNNPIERARDVASQVERADRGGDALEEEESETSTKSRKSNKAKTKKSTSNKNTRDKNSDEKTSSKSSRTKNKTSNSKDKGTPIAEGTRESTQKRVILATWNLENFFDTVDDSYKDDVLSEREYADKLSRLSRVVQEVDADIIGVEEVEKQESLEELAERSGYPYVAFYPGNDHIRGINVGVMSRIPIRNYVSHARDRFGSGGERGAFSRDCFEVHFKHKSNFTLLVNHFKSKIGGEKSDAKRFLQAQRVVEIAKDLNNFPVAICGDLNDDPENKPLSPLIKCKFLTDTLGHLPKNQRLTFFSKKYQSALDYIFVNDKLKPAFVKDSVKIFTDIPDIDKASDHRPVRIELDLSKIK